MTQATKEGRAAGARQGQKAGRTAPSGAAGGRAVGSPPSPIPFATFPCASRSGDHHSPLSHPLMGGSGLHLRALGHIQKEMGSRGGLVPHLQVIGLRQGRSLRP